MNGQSWVAEHIYEYGNGMSSRVYNRDCLAALRDFGDNQFDLAVIDPPYGIGIDGGIGGGVLAPKSTFQKKNWDSAPPSKEYFDELMRVSKNQIIWGVNHFVHLIGIGSPCWLVWDKDNGKNSFADSELAWTSFDTAVRNFRFRWQGMLQGDMRNKESKIHPTQKPVKLYDWILENYAKPDDKVLDTHLGSGSSRIACAKRQIDFTGFEIDSEYFCDSVKRFEQSVKQKELFL